MSDRPKLISQHAPRKQPVLGLRMSQLPILNVRQEFAMNHRTVHSPEFRKQLAEWKPGRAIHGGYIVVGDPNLLFTLVIQRTIIGLESYLPGAVFVAGAHYDRWSADLVRGIRDPFSLGCKSTAHAYFNCLPGKIDEGLQLLRSRQKLWTRVKSFYESIRNPLFHGSQLDIYSRAKPESAEPVFKVFDLFSSVYDWIDWWCPPAFFSGPAGPVPKSEIPKQRP